jgi:8-oxo-dGTP pyrophosphatase MutT (NUDIX family)
LEQWKILPPGQFDGPFVTPDFVAERLRSHPVDGPAHRRPAVTEDATALAEGRLVPEDQLPGHQLPGHHLPGHHVNGDHDLNPGTFPVQSLTRAAVLVPIVDRPNGLTILLTQRTAHLTDHAGQISFPGGRMEPDDPHPTAAALRETAEEVGLSADRIDILGRLDTYVTVTGYEIIPIVGLVRPPFILTPDPFEVAEVFEVPLAFIVDPANHQKHSSNLRGQTRHFFVLPYQNRYIWGATAGMLVNLAGLLRP